MAEAQAADFDVDDVWDDENTNDNDWNDMELQYEQNDGDYKDLDNSKMESWKIELDNTYTKGILELNDDKTIAIKYFIQCIKLEKSNTDIVNKRFYSMIQIIMLQSQNIKIIDVDNNICFNDILKNFELLLKFYNAKNPTQYITNNHITFNKYSFFCFF